MFIDTIQYVRSQGVKYCKLVPAKASTDDLLENSANYFLTEDEVSIIFNIW